MNAPLIAALFAASLVGAGLALAVAVLVHRRRTRRLELRWRAINRALQQGGRQ